MAARKTGVRTIIFGSTLNRNKDFTLNRRALPLFLSTMLDLKSIKVLRTVVRGKGDLKALHICCGCKGRHY